MPISETQRRTRFQQHYMLIMLTVLSGVSIIDRLIITTVAEQIKHDLKLSDTQLGLLTGVAFAAVYAGMSLPLARIADRVNRPKLIATGLAFWSALTAVTGMAQNFWQILAARMGVGIGEAALSPAAQAMISDAYPPERRASALSIYTAGAAVGTFVGAVAGGAIAQAFGWRMACLLIGLPGVILAVVVAITLKDPPRGQFDEPDSPGAPAKGFKEAVLTIVKSPVYCYTVFASTIYALAMFSVGAFLVAYLQRAFGISLFHAGLAYGLTIVLTGAPGMIAGGFLADRLCKRDKRYQLWVPALSLLLASPFVTLGLLQPTAMLLGLFIIPMNFIFAMSAGPAAAAALSSVKPDVRATAVAVMMIVTTLIGMGVGPVMTGFFSDLFANRTAGGDLAALCADAGRAQLCRGAQAEGLKIAMVIGSTLFFVAGLIYLRGASFLGGPGSARNEADGEMVPVSHPA